MKDQPLTTALRFRQPLFTAAALLVGSLAFTLHCGPARALEPPAAAITNLSPESLEVDAALYSSQSFEWLDAPRQRRVPAKVYLPTKQAAAGTLPLIVFSHGLGGSRDGYSYLGRYFAANGYASLHVQHVGSDRHIWAGNPLSLVSRLSDAAQDSEALSRVQDLRFAMDQMLSAPEGAVLDKRRIVAAGHSYGANTSMLIAGALVEQQGQKVSLRDPRISAAILISAPPFYGMGDPKKILAGIEIPTLHITATEDVIQIPGYNSGLQDRVDVFNALGTDKAAPKVLAVFKEGSHSIFTDRARTGGVTLNPQVKIATRQLALAFLEGLHARNYAAVEAWPLSHASILSSFEKRLH